MIPLKHLRENKAEIIEGLQKRNFKQTDLLDTLLSLDEKRRKTQTNLTNNWQKPISWQKKLGSYLSLVKQRKRKNLKRVLEN